jgi:sporulation protein YlmC with PRC-barrel domain
MAGVGLGIASVLTYYALQEALAHGAAGALGVYHAPRVRVTTIVGLPVVDAHLARQAGVVADVELDLRSARLAAINVRHSDGWLVQRVPAELVHSIERGTVLVQDSVDLHFRPPMAPSADWVGTASLAGLEVLNEAGDRVGRVFDADIDGSTLCIRGYLLEERRWLLWRRRLLPNEVLSVSPDVMIVRVGRRS